MADMFGRKIRLLRERHGIRQKDIAHKLNILQSHINHLEAGRKQPLVPLVLMYAQMFHVSTDALLLDSWDIEVVESYYDADVMMPTYPQAFGRKLRSLRKGRGLKQAELAQHLGLSQIFVSFLEVGRKNPTPAMIVAMATLFEVSTDLLLLDSLELIEE